MAVLNVRDYGAVGDGITDDTTAFRNCLADAGLTNSVYIPIGVYKILGTIWVKSGTLIEGEDEHQSKIILGDGFSLDSIPFRSTPIQPIITTDDNSQDIIMRKFTLEGNKKTIVRGNYGMGGIVFQKTVNGKLENVHVNWINIKEDLTDRDFGFNIISVDADNIEYYRCSGEYSGYQPFGFFDRTFNSLMHECTSGMGWRTSVQVHRDTDNNRIINNTIIQPDNPFDTEPHAAVTFHGEPGEEARNITFDGNYVECGAGYKAALQAFRQSEGLTVTNNTIKANGEGVRIGDASGATVEYNKIFSVANNLPLEYGNIGINIIDYTFNSTVRYNEITGFATPIYQAENSKTNVIVFDNTILEYSTPKEQKVYFAKLFKNENGKIVELDSFVENGVLKRVVQFVKY